MFTVQNPHLLHGIPPCPTMQPCAAQCCHQESISVKPQPTTTSMKKYSMAAPLTRAVRVRVSTQMFCSDGALQRPDPDRPALTSGAGGATGVCFFFFAVHEVAGCGAITLTSPLTLQITTAPFNPGGPGSGYKGGGGDRSGTVRRSQLRWTTSSGGGQMEH